MPRTRRRCMDVSSLLVTLCLLLAASAARAETPAKRALEAKRLEQRLARIEERQTQVVPEGALAHMQLDLSQSQLELARKALERHNERAAKELAAEAERCLKQAEPQGVQP